MTDHHDRSDVPSRYDSIHDATLRVAKERMTHVARLATMGEMAAGIAHELNQPLAAIANYASAAGRLAALQARGSTDTDGELPLALTQIGEQALRAGEIIRTLRALAQNRQTQREFVDVNELVEEVLRFARSDLRLNEVQIITEFGVGLPLALLDRIQIQQVLLNLLRNAIEALAVKPRERRVVQIRTSCDDTQRLLIEVTDDGPGASEDLVTRMFDPFFTTKETGTGLGLAISRTIVRAHRGEIYHRAVSTGGASFVVELPGPSGSGE
ncbi:MAG: GHKL domain-containing protein [Gammaproteobacteria bacterium]|jgi:two-component system sensor kinase FixL|nr:GHKL domain-containing protein [Gammaproteobacteria bacterium]